jgi:hypothetical protein
VLSVKWLIVAMLVVITLFGNIAIAENKGVCPPPPPAPSSKKTAPLDVGAISVSASVLVVISDTGYVCSTQLLQQADDEVATEVASAVRQLHFDPAKKDGHGVPVVVTIEVNVQRDESGKIVVSSTRSSSNSNSGDVPSATSTNTRTKH